MYKIDSGSVLLLGEGDFSFSTAFHPKIPSVCKMVSTSYLSEADVLEVHKNAGQNIAALREKGVEVHHSIDGTKLSESVLHDRKFSRIIFNFPHIGGKSNIKKNRELLKNFFPSAVGVLSADGDICVTLAQGQGGTPCDTSQRQWHDTWQVVAAAAYSDMVLADVIPFSINQYEGYCSTGFRSRDQQFYTKGGLTYMFRRSQVVVEALSDQAQDVSPVLNSTLNVLLPRHIARDIDRDLLSISNHPITLSADNFLENFMGRLSAFKLSLDNFKDVSQKLPLVLQKHPQEKETTYQCIKSDQSETKVCLRSTLIDAFQENYMKNESLLEDNMMYFTKGAVFRRVGLDSEDIPIQHEMCVFAKENDVITQEKFEEEVKSALASSLPNCKQEWENQALPGYLNNALCESSSTIKVHYKSENEYYRVACNQVEAKGPAELKKNIPKIVEKNVTVGYLGKVVTVTQNWSADEHKDKKLRMDSGVLVCCLKLDVMSQIRYDIPDQAVSFTEEERFLSQFQGLHHTEMRRFKPLSLFPPMWRHDLSCWEDEGVDGKRNEEDGPQGFDEFGEEVVDHGEEVKEGGKGITDGDEGIKDGGAGIKDGDEGVKNFGEGIEKCSGGRKNGVEQSTDIKNTIQIKKEVQVTTFDTLRLCNIVRDVTCGTVRCVMCMNVWAEPQDGRVSLCHRLLYQSPCTAVSHAHAHTFQNAVRLTVAKEMGVELR